MTYSASPGAAQACALCGSGALRVLEGGFAEARSAARDLASGDHAALGYDDSAAAAEFCARYLSEGVDVGDRVVAALPGDLRDAVRDRLPAEVAGAIEWRETSSLYGDFDADRVGTVFEEMIGGEPRRSRILAGIDRDCAAGVDAAEWDRYERMAHGIVTEHGSIGVCLYDTRELPDDFMEVAARRHGLTVVDGAVRRNAAFEYEPA